ncbi:MAG: GxxExxY protein [Acidobacteria bacterium]|nr:GxxExxY protein [Acidobacteriota bacterium]
MKALNEITGEIVDAAFKLHTRLGPGLLESVYEVVLAKQLERRGLTIKRQEPVSFEFDGLSFDEGFKVDLLVEGRVVVELKSVEKLAPVHSKQLLTYLKLLNLQVGLLINFGGPTLKEGLHRIVNNYRPPAVPASSGVGGRVGSGYRHGPGVVKGPMPTSTGSEGVADPPGSGSMRDERGGAGKRAGP